MPARESRPGEEQRLWLISGPDASEREEHVVNGGCEQKSLGECLVRVEDPLVGGRRLRRRQRGAR